MNRTSLSIFILAIFISFQGMTQWTETSLELTSPGTSYTKLQFAEHIWSGSHAILFNAYKNITTSGSLETPHNTSFANNQGAYSGGAGAIMFFGNGGLIDFLISPAAGASGGGTGITWGTPKMRINRSGEVGIGTVNTTGYRLSVAGKIRAEEVKVETGWADHVFKENYPLKSINELKEFIATNNHLPGIPTEEEVKEKGVSLGEMSAKLLEKIEELTLYVIDLKEENDAMKREINQLKESQ